MSDFTSSLSNINSSNNLVLPEGVNKSSSLNEISNSQQAQWPTDEKLYKLVRIIGQGATSKVYAAEYNDKKCAIKIIDLENCSSNDGLKEINREIASMKRLKHENIIGYYVSFVKNTRLEIVMDLCEKGSLLDLIKVIQNTRGLQQGVFDEVTIATILRDVMRGLNYIHENDLVHRDLKCGNLLVRDDGCIQIADFGVTAFLNTSLTEDSNEVGTRRTFVGTPCWMAPEVMNQMSGNQAHGYNWKADIWSLGITTIELATGQAPYARYAPFKVLMMTLQNEPPTIDTCATYPNQYENYGQKFRKFCRSCLVKDPSQRASTKDLLQHTYIKAKAKDRDFIIKTLFSGNIPSPQIVKEPDEDDTQPALQPAALNVEWEFSNALTTAEDSNLTVQASGTSPPIDFRNPNLSAAGGGAPLTAQALSNATITTPAHPPTSAGTVAPQSAAAGGALRSPLLPNSLIYRITLMKRNPAAGNELQNISFAYVVGQDTAESLTNDLVGNELLERSNFIIVAHTIQKLIDDPNLKEKCFPLNMTLPSGVIPNESTMEGYAKLSICLYDPERDKDLL